MSLLVISGISGAGKTVATNTLEDMGYYCIDNLPPELLIPVSKLNYTGELAVIIDSRSKEKYQSLLSEIEKLKKEEIDYKLLFLYCDKDTILGRYKYTRRTHPLVSDENPSLQDAIEDEFALCKDVMEAADIVIDTTHLSNAQFRKTIMDTFKFESYQGLTIKLISFGYKNGLPSEADLVYDVRCMPNPFYIPELRQYSGLDKQVVDYVFSFQQSETLLDKMEDFVKYSLPYFVEEGKTELVIAIGCTSGHHRSVAFTEKLKERLSDSDHRIMVMHRDIDKEF